MELQSPTKPPAASDSFSNPSSTSPSNLLPSYRRSPIVLKFMLISLPLLVLACLALLILGPRFYRLHSMENLQDKAESIGRVAAFSLAPAIIFNDTDNIDEFLKSLSQTPEVEYILVSDETGRELGRYQRPDERAAAPSASSSLQTVSSAVSSTSSSTASPLSSLPSPLESKPSATPKTAPLPAINQINKTGLSPDGLFWNFFTPVEHQGELVGYLTVGFSLKTLNARLTRINHLFLISSLLVFAFGLLTFYSLSLLVTRPLRKMTRTVNQIAAGNLDLRLDMTTSDEVGQLASIFNVGLEELQKTMRHLEEAKQTLEKKVEERTAELKQQVEETEAIARKLSESEELFRNMVESLGEAVIIVDNQERFTFANPAARRIFNDTEQKLEGQSLQEFTTAKDFEYLRQQTLRRQQGYRDTYDLELNFPDSSKKSVIVNAAPRINPDGQIIGTLAVLTDITERKRQEKALSEAKDELEKAITELQQRNKNTVQLVEMGEAIGLAKSEEEAIKIVINFGEKLFPKETGLFYLRPAKENFLELISSWNQAAEAETIINLDDCWALRRSLPHFVDPSNRAFLCPHLKNIIKTPERSACLPLSSAGETIGLLALYCCLPDKSGQTSAFMLSNLAESEAKKSLLIAFSQRVATSLANIRLRESLRQQSIRDPLTGLYNRRYLEETLEREFAWARRASQPVSIIMFDIDHFKKVNDLFGHDAGDVALQTIAGQLQKSVRTEDIVCRFGGEEFTVVMPALPLDRALNRANLILESVRNLELSSKGMFIQKITMSAGVASFPLHGETPANVLQSADLSLLRAKNEGRDRAQAADKPVS
ncbi:MAG: diguanylate cyclase [Acidobacteriota bacterium]|nr:diguanylate cyclase [Acidobacteriota bacterium]